MNSSDNGKYILAIDQGTSGSKAIIFNNSGEICFEGRAPLKSFYPSEGRVEQDPDEIYRTVLSAVRGAAEAFTAAGNNPKDIACCGISNQRETFVLWDKAGCPLAPAVVWQCKRSIPVCRRLLDEGYEKLIREHTGLFIDPYFSATKVVQLCEENPEIRRAVDSGEAYFGTVDSWLLFRLTGGVHKIDYTNASRTMLFNLKDLSWDNELIELFGLSGLKLPEAVPSGADFGCSDFDGIFARPLQITAMIGDSHAAAFGEGCFEKGAAKATMGTGSSILLNTGELVEPADTTMVSTICWSTEEQVSYALEGIIVSCGSTLTWLRDQLGLFNTSAEASEIAMQTGSSGTVILIPAFSGLGAPWWKMSEQASIRGLSFESDKNHVIRAGFESIVFQITDVLHAMEKDANRALKSIRIDGGVSESSFVMSSIAELNKAEIRRCRLREASALGAALMAGLKGGVYESIEQLKKLKYDDEIITETEDNQELQNKYEQWVETMRGL
ncbi:MAG TPA: carbohydrate kinase [Spirochaeta sp.]|nr:carbohydrate kinase [Spirochaeta sp.]